MRLEDARERWRSSGIDDYEITVTRICFCPAEARGPVIVEVRDGAAISRRFADGLGPVPERFAEFFPTVEGIFDFLRESLDQGAESVSAEFDPDLGHPTDAYVDLDERVADEEVGFEVQNLTPRE